VEAIARVGTGLYDAVAHDAQWIAIRAVAAALQGYDHHAPQAIKVGGSGAGAASDERLAPATMKAASERAKIGRTKWLIDSLPFFDLATAFHLCLIARATIACLSSLLGLARDWRAASCSATFLFSAGSIYPTPAGLEAVEVAAERIVVVRPQSNATTNPFSSTFWLWCFRQPLLVHRTKIPGTFLHHHRRAAIVRRRKVTLREDALAPTAQHLAMPLVPDATLDFGKQPRAK
jgi:hypothetical protein